MACNCENEKNCCAAEPVSELDSEIIVAALAKTIKADVIKSIRNLAGDMMAEAGVCESGGIWEKAVEIVGNRIENGDR